MKKITIVAFLFWSAFSVYGQMTLSSGSQIVVSSGSEVVANDITNSGGTITNNGDVSVKGDITNNTSDLFDASSTGTVTFEGTSAQEITGDHDIAFYGTVDINNTNGVSLTATSTGADQTINGTLHFTSGNLTLNGFNLTIGTTDPTNAGSTTGYIVTNSTGSVKRTVGSSDVTYPVGNTDYNPVTLNNAGTSDTYGVRVVDNEPANASTNHMVDRSWVVTENTAGGSDLTVTPQWNSSEELTAFDRTSSQVGLTTDNGSSYTWGSVGAATGSDPYTRTGTGFNGVGTFAMGDYYYGGLSVNLKMFLAGAYNTTNHNMDNTLNTAGLIPTTDPYGLNTTVTAVPSGAVDWVEVQLRSTTTDTTARFAKFVNQSGQIIEEDGSNMKVTGVDKGSYYISVHHRNHLPVMSASTVDLSAASPSFDFSTALAQAWVDATVITNDAMKQLESGVWGLWEGDANGDGEIQYASGGNSDQGSILNEVGTTTPGNISNNVYKKTDVNMDGQVQYASGGNSDQGTILNVIGTTTPGNIFKAHLPH